MPHFCKLRLENHGFCGIFLCKKTSVEQKLMFLTRKQMSPTIFMSNFAASKGIIKSKGTELPR